MTAEIKRRHDWRTRLQDYIVPLMRKPFGWGVNDCALFTAGAVEAMTGRDLARGFRGYRTEAAGRKRMMKAGFADQFAIADANFERVHPAFAQVGDVAAVPTENGDALGVVQGEFIYLVTARGLGLVPMTRAKIAWRVP